MRPTTTSPQVPKVFVVATGPRPPEKMSCQAYAHQLLEFNYTAWVVAPAEEYHLVA